MQGRRPGRPKVLLASLPDALALMPSNARDPCFNSVLPPVRDATAFTLMSPKVFLFLAGVTSSAPFSSGFLALAVSAFSIVVSSPSSVGRFTSNTFGNANCHEDPCIVMSAEALWCCRRRALSPSKLQAIKARTLLRTWLAGWIFKRSKEDSSDVENSSHSDSG